MQSGQKLDMFRSYQNIKKGEQLLFANFSFFTTLEKSIYQKCAQLVTTQHRTIYYKISKNLSFNFTSINMKFHTCLNVIQYELWDVIYRWPHCPCKVLGCFAQSPPKTTMGQNDANFLVPCRSYL